MKDIKPEELPSKGNLIEWYNTLLRIAWIIDRRYPIKGTFVWMPYGIEIMLRIKNYWDELFKNHGIKETYFPLFVPEEFAKKNEKWYSGFKDEVFFAVPSRNPDEKYVIRPTGEPAMYPMFALWVKEGHLPIRIYQTVSSFRNEGKTTHSMVRDREITFWYEIHTAHKTREEAEEEFNLHIELNKKIWKFLAIPPIIVNKPVYEVFPGAVGAVEFYTILPNGRLLENGSVNNLGQAYSKIFDVYYVDEKGNKHYVWQICTGNGARFLVAAIMLHGDERGLVLPPKIAPIEVVIIPIYTKENKELVIKEARRTFEKLKGQFRVELDEREEITPGEKFYQWDIKGVPIRIEIGKDEVKSKKITIFRRDKKTKESVDEKQLEKTIEEMLNDIQTNLEKKVRDFYNSKIKTFSDLKEASKWIKEGGIAKVNWCESLECYEKFSEIEPSVEAIGTLIDETKEGKCIVCGKKTDKVTLVGKTY